MIKQLIVTIKYVKLSKYNLNQFNKNKKVLILLSTQTVMSCKKSGLVSVHSGPS